MTVAPTTVSGVKLSEPLRVWTHGSPGLCVASKGSEVSVCPGGKTEIKGPVDQYNSWWYRDKWSTGVCPTW